MINKEVQLSDEFKSQTVKAIMAIVIFAIVYLIVLAFAAGLTALCAYGGFMIFTVFPSILGFVLGIGLASLGLLILFFLIKFIFKSNKVDRSHLVEIKQKNEPELFEMIRLIVDEVGTSFPKKIYLSAEVNASVFYNSSFWSMFLPIRKNLVIGLGLVNSVSKEELKAILSHEFGHFSQKTMKVGSYVYNVNQVIFNMLYDNQSYDRTIQGLASMSGFIAIFVMIGVKIVNGIQLLLKLMYEFVNKKYMALSREMEFHADEIAANVTGYQPLKKSLLRLDLANFSFNAVLAFYDQKIEDNIRSENVYKEHAFLMEFYAKEDDIELKDGLPVIELEHLSKYNKSKLVIKDQWASHPSTEERIERLEQTNLISENHDTTLANELFSDIDSLQVKLTNQIFEPVKYEGEPISDTIESFKTKYQDDFSKNSFPKIYNGYYDNKKTIPFDMDELEFAANPIKIADLYSEENVQLKDELTALQNDIQVIEQISDKKMKIKTFDFDGQKYKQKQSKTLLAKLRRELDELTERLKSNDILVFQFFQQKEQGAGNSGRLIALYKNMFEFDQEQESKIKIYTDLSEKLQFISRNNSVDQVKSFFRDVGSIEKRLKSTIKEMMDMEKYRAEIPRLLVTNFDNYLDSELQYFGEQGYNNENLEILFSSLNGYAFLLSRGYFINVKEVLTYQNLLIEQ